MTDAPIVPLFDDADAAERTLAIICSKGSLDMAYPPLVMGNAALGEGVQLHLFFTFWGLDMITKSRMNDLHFTPMANPATHMPMPITGVPGLTGMATRQMKKAMDDLGVPPVPEFLDQIVAAGGHLWACKLTADMNKLTMADFYDGVEAVISATEFIEKTAGAQLLFV